MTTQATNVSEFFDSYAQEFNAIYGNRNTLINRVINTCLRSSMRLRYEKAIAGCQPIEGRSVVDIGTGPGHYAITLAKCGAARVLGLDFAEGMIQLARRNAGQLGVTKICEFVLGDFLSYPFNETFDYAVAMGFMDYIAEPRPVIEKVLAITRGKAFFSFPAAGGLLAWQRKVRYRRRCDLYLYRRDQIAELFAGTSAANIRIEKIARDFFVTATMPSFACEPMRTG